ncbi:TlpA family protein disulfide reductase [Psychroserpens sp. Hel_I_66]|uniref:TlpA family protein disulfide reductase n=1 Tax=Psychroserpens sp. Hel_I_66 TaxID=1250004 RepID=UPI00068FD109|nr:hypothetical protein [Psychroserpens sp. Hel_I_66]
MKLLIVSILSSFLFIGCDTNSEVSDVAYFGGEIINPNNNYVTLFSNEKDRDTIMLDANNRFIHKIENLKAGLYSFTHGGEFQTLLIEPKDSIMLRLNTNDFDESLVYTGDGSKKNNYLIKAFLNNEIENKKFNKLQHLEPEEFEKHIRTVQQQRQENLERFIETQQTSSLFKKIAEAGIDYSYYTIKEKYPFGYFGNNKLIHFKDLPEDFYDYREEVDFNDIELSRVYSYNKFMDWYFHNTALNTYYRDGNHHKFNRQALDYNLEKLRLIDSVIENEVIKNYVLKHATRVFVYNSSNQAQSKSMLDSFMEKSTDDDDKDYIDNLVNSTTSLYPGNKLPNIEIVNFNNEVLNLHEVINAPTVIYCWSSNFKYSYRNNHFMMKSLKSRYPDMNFIAININDMDTRSWKQTLSLLKYPTENEYMFKNPNEAIKKFAIAYAQKVLIVDENGIIIEPNTDLFSTEIDTIIEHTLVSK